MRKKRAKQKGGFSPQHTESCLPAARFRDTTPALGLVRQ